MNKGVIAGVLLAGLGFVAAGRRVERTRYRPDRWRTGEIVTALSGIAAAVLVNVVAHRQPAVGYPSLTAWPTLSAPALTAAMIAVVPAFLTPPPVLDQTVTQVHA